MEPIKNAACCQFKSHSCLIYNDIRLRWIEYNIGLSWISEVTETGTPPWDVNILACWASIKDRHIYRMPGNHHKVYRVVTPMTATSPGGVSLQGQMNTLPGIWSAGDRCFSLYQLVWIIQSSLLLPGRDISEPQSYMKCFHNAIRLTTWTSYRLPLLAPCWAFWAERSKNPRCHANTNVCQEVEEEFRGPTHQWHFYGTCRVIGSRQVLVLCTTYQQIRVCIKLSGTFWIQEATYIVLECHSDVKIEKPVPCPFWERPRAREVSM